jgi:hypothetical protein
VANASIDDLRNQLDDAINATAQLGNTPHAELVSKLKPNAELKTGLRGQKLNINMSPSDLSDWDMRELGLPVS